MKALIIEDNKLTSLTLRTLLEKAGHQVAGEISDGSKAAEAVARLNPDLVFLDLILPGRRGTEILPEIKTAFPEMKVIVITALTEAALDAQLIEKGASCVIHKPFSYSELKEALSTIV